MPNIGVPIIAGLAVILLLLLLALCAQGNITGVLVFFIAVSLVLCGVLISWDYFTGKEGFHFKVSPQRTKCLLEQVLPIPRTAECCGKGTVGGYPPQYQEWLDPPAMKRTEAAPVDLSIPDYVPHETCPSKEQFEYETVGKEGKTAFVYYFHGKEVPEGEDPREEGFTLHGKSRRDILEAMRK
jgi:hypothetical protein